MKQSEDKIKTVVSLTSFPRAIDYAAGAVRSVLEGSVRPDRLVLYVTMSQFGDMQLPEELLELQKRDEIFEIRDYEHEIKSYRKLVPALKEFPEARIVTIDDDVKYHRDMLKDLLKLHEQFPNDIIAHRAKRIQIGIPYRKWKKYRWYHFLKKKVFQNFSTIQTGVGGVLYPPHSLREDMLKEELFTKFAPTADDLWFWAAAVANGRKIIPVPFGHNKPKGLGKPRELSLKTINFKSGKDRNSEALNAILNAYPEIKERVESGN